MDTRLIQTPHYGHPVNTDTIYGPLSVLINAGLLIGREEKSQISRVFYGQIGLFHGNFVGNFRANFAKKQSLIKGLFLWLFSRQISLETNPVCTDQTSVFNVFLTEAVICSFNNNTLKK